ncbi:TPA: hypothetical protein ACXK4S_000687 [Pseudomonas aeruginosa]
MDYQTLVKELESLITSTTSKARKSEFFQKNQQLLNEFLNGTYDKEILQLQDKNELQNLKAGVSIIAQKDTPELRTYLSEATESIYGNPTFQAHMRPYTQAVALNLVLDGYDFRPFRNVPGWSGIADNSQELTPAIKFTALRGYAQHVEKNDFVGVVNDEKTNFLKVGDREYYLKDMSPTDRFAEVDKDVVKTIFSQKSFLDEDLGTLNKYCYSESAAKAVLKVHQELEQKQSIKPNRPTLSQ